ncbi:MAG: DNA polymerase III subunit delta [Treponema sp.]|jgi:DNA polymerase-3 subunit delta|nr:DNA polymerase III subunit delta [Treponema sp.]
MYKEKELPAPDAEKGRCFLFLGPEIGEKNEAITEIRRSLETGPGGNRTLEETSFYAGESTANDMSAALRNASLFSDTRLFLIKNADLIKDKNDTELLASYIRSPQQGTTVIFLSDEIKISKVLEDAVPPNNKRIFWELFENRKGPWIRDFFRQKGCRISDGGITIVLELVENNTEALKRECGRLALFYGQDRLIDTADVEECLSHTREESSFTLFSRIAAGDLSKCLESLHSLRGTKETFQSILSGLTWCFRRLRDYQTLLEAGVLPPGIGKPGDLEFKKIGLGSLKNRADYVEANRRYGRGAADRFLSLTAEYDAALRRGGTQLETLLFEMFFIKLVNSGRSDQAWGAR